MKTSSENVGRWAPAAALAAIAALFLLAQGGYLSWTQGARQISSPIGEEIIVMRTSGGLLEVSTIETTEHFDQTNDYTVLGVRVGKTVPHIQVRATYRYHIELAREWVIRIEGGVFEVVAPPVRPSLPVAVDLSSIDKSVAGTWLLNVLYGDEDLEVLEREITAKLAAKANSLLYKQMQRESARATIEEFVRKWLVTQSRWSKAGYLDIRVRFEDDA